MDVCHELDKMCMMEFIIFCRHLLVTFTCPMKLHNYPMDTQSCPIMIESFGQTMDKLQFVWLENPVDLDASIRYKKAFDLFFLVWSLPIWSS